ncbi:hypothetical protein BDA96_07G229300 [Sorghum bicolor]|uniref:EGF-like domain-containing protein n=2 Tax=Sorghum bicolor TaxID=4558 RepID=A0A921QMQ3_SORBI|nr:hypothetical protein BDA96_07G229300 [Sorghum bicolor]OQU80973.1 hypothetical protein SORBI_3007G216001 [Sorghum bicolor]
MSIPHPFGVEPWCYLPGFNVTCRNENDDSHGSSSPKLFLGDGTVEVLEISIANATVRINASLAYFPGTDKDNFLGPKPIITTDAPWSGALGKGGKAGVYTLGWRSNRLFAIGCNVQVLLDDDDLEGAGAPPNNSSKTLSTCATFCDWDEHEQSCSLPAVLDWRINHTTCHGNGSSAACRSSNSFCEYMHYRIDQGHICSCAQGYQGNPYLPNGCKDVNECEDPNTYQFYGVCNNTKGGYHCECPTGFVGNASLPSGCKDVDECAHPELHSCYGVCINMPGTFHCRCKQGTYYGDPFTKGGCSSLSVLKIGLAVGGGMVFFAFGNWCTLRGT